MKSEAKDSGREEMRRDILAAALRAVPFDGWSADALASGIDAAVRAGADPLQAQRAFPGGAAQLLDFFMAEADREMVAEAAASGLGEGPVRERIGGIIRLRLENLAPHRESIRRALTLQLLPGRAPGAIRGLSRTVDAIWRAAGDDSTDFNYYSKRALLAAVYSSTLLRWLDDESEDCVETWDFLERRIAGTLRLGKVRRRAGKLLRRIPSPLPVLTRLRYGRRSRRAA
jgi:ubiquinone biosynthesis protein COQ9